MPITPPPSPQQVAALQFIKAVSDKMFSVGKRWVSDEHAVAFREGDISRWDILQKLGTKPGAPVTPEYELASKLSDVLGIKCKYMHHEGYVIEGKDSLDKLANAGIKAIAKLGYGENGRALI